MPVTHSKPPAPPAKPAGPNPAVPPTGSPTVALGGGAPHTSRLQRAVGLIDEDSATPTNVRSIIGSYYRFINPSGTTEHLPRSLKVHPADAEKSLNPGTRWDIFFFTLGNSIKALQNAYALDAAYSVSQTKTPETRAAVFAAIDLLEQRTARLEHLAKHGPAEWVVRGMDGTGYFLVSKAENTALMLADLEAGTAAEARRNNPRPIRGAEIKGDAD